MIVNKRLKYIFFIFLMIILGILVFFSIVSNNYRIAKEVLKNEVNIVELKEMLKESKLDVEVKINDNQTYYNEIENMYLYCVDSNEINTYKNMRLRILSKEKYKYVIDSEKYDEKKGIYIDCDEPIDLIIYNEEFYWQTQIKFSNLPIFNIETHTEIPLYTYEKVRVELFSPNYRDKRKMLLVKSDAQMKVRGNSSLVHPKKQYRMSLTYGDNKNKISFLGMKEDEDYILDAMYSDFSKIRNKLSFDIWNQINSYNVNYSEIDLKSEYVDLYINQEYTGLYLLKEFIDWKNLGLNEFTEGNTGIYLKGDWYLKWDQEVYESDKIGNSVLRIYDEIS